MYIPYSGDWCSQFSPATLIKTKIVASGSHHKLHSNITIMTLMMFIFLKTCNATKESDKYMANKEWIYDILALDLFVRI